MSENYPPLANFPVSPAGPEASPQPSRPNLKGGFRSCLLMGLGVVLGMVAVWQLYWLFRPRMEMPPRLREVYFSHEKRAWDRVAIISLSGMIVDEEEGFVKRQIDQALKDERVKAVVLRINSPGGTITDSDYLYHHLTKLREKKPLVVSMGSVAASGGYYVAMAVGSQADSIFAEPTTWTGSIGVLVFHMNVQELLNRLGVEAGSITSSPLKDMGSIFRKMTEEERELFQSLVDRSLARFKEVIKSGRPKFAENPEELDKVATGQIFTAQEAKELGLVDRIGFLEDAVQRAIELAGLDPAKVCVIRYKREVSLSDLLWGGQIGLAFDLEIPLFRWRERLAAAFPRAYYLMNAVPTEWDWAATLHP